MIEHVTPGSIELSANPDLTDSEWQKRSRDLQRAFAVEIRRVSRSYFVQTPHRMFPVEAHTGTPMANYLSHNSTIKLVRALTKTWPRPIGNVDWNLFTAEQMEDFFQDGKIEVEKLLGLPKSIIAWKTESTESCLTTEMV